MEIGLTSNLKKLSRPLFDGREALFYRVILVVDHESGVHLIIRSDGGLVRPLQFFISS